MRYFLQKGKLTGPKRSNFVRLPSSVEIHTRSKTKHLRDLLQKMQRWRPRANAFCDFSTSPVQSTVPATEKWGQVIRSAAPVMQNHLSKPEELMLQNATPLRKSAPWPAVWWRYLLYSACQTKCIPADLLQTSHARTRILSSTCASRHSGGDLFNISTSKGAPGPEYF